MNVRTFRPVPHSRRGRPEVPRVTCSCGHPWEAHATHHRRKPCRRCACIRYLPPPAPLPLRGPGRPEPPTAEELAALRQATRLPCTCAPHTPRQAGCAVCTAYAKGLILLTTGEQVRKTVWYQAWGVKGGTGEEG